MELEREIERSIEELDIYSNSQFALIGNNIDGYVNIKTIIFINYEQLKTEFEKIILNLSFCGEWDLILYSIPDNYTLQKKWNYYIYPEPAIEIKKFSYMDPYYYKIHFKNNSFTTFARDAYYSSDFDDFGHERNKYVQTTYKYETFKLNFKL